MSALPIIVQKYGGMSLAEPALIRAAARRVAQLRASGHNVIAVVSAMGKTTDDLIAKAYSVSAKPNRRELDMLLSTGERVSMALFSMALTEALKEFAPQAKAISFTGSQAGILTDETHSNARIIDVRPVRVQEELSRSNVVILAGFQGVSPKTKEITTLGRGGTDVTAVAMAAAFKAKRCEILKEVEGVLSADPKLISSARLLTHLEHKHLLDMTFWGAKVLHYRSVELAMTSGVPLFVGLAHTHQQGTLIDGVPMTGFENDHILSVNSHADVRLVRVSNQSGGPVCVSDALKLVNETLCTHQLPLPQILDVQSVESETTLLITAPSESLDAQVQALKSTAGVRVDDDKRSSVTVTCQGSYSTDLTSRLCARLHEAGISPDRILSHALSLTFVVPAASREQAVRVLHAGL